MMKKLLLFVTLIFAQSNLSAQVLLEKLTYAGEVLPADAIATQCRLLDNGQIISEKQLNGLKSTQTLPVKLTVAAIKSTIEVAAIGSITSLSFPVDATTQIYRAYFKQANGKLKSVLLWEENGGSGIKRTNSMQEAIMLRNFIDLSCGNAVQP